MKERITLQPGDYISTKGLTEADYHAVARAFMAAGAESGEYPYSDLDLWKYFGWNDSRDALEFWDRPRAFGNDSRHLTPQQVINAANAGTATPDPLTTILEQAAEHDATARHHAAMHERLMAEAREMLPDGWRLVRDEDIPDGPSMTIVDGENMSDPANWREGDVFKITQDQACCADVEKGELVILDKAGGSFFTSQETGKCWDLGPDVVSFHHRP